jgi:hypothetical protein
MFGLTRSLPGLLLAASISSAAEPGRLWVRLLDQRGAPTAARIYVSDAAGTRHAPSGSIVREIGRNKQSFFHALGHFQVDLPPGKVTIEAIKGFEFVPAKEQVELKPNQTTVATLVLKRWIDLPGLGWHSGDVHMHPNHVLGGLNMTMEDCKLYAQAEDIRVANLLISNTDASHVYDTEHFRGGKPDPLSTDDYLLVVQQEFRNTSAMYGHMPLLGISRLVEPFFSGQPQSNHSEDYPPNYAIAKAAKEQGGAVCYTHPAQREEIPVGPHLAREFPIDLALGVVDALDILGNGNEEAGCWMYYRVLNCGLKCAASSGSDSRMDVNRHAVSGGGKVYVRTGNPLTYEKWVAGYKAGRTFVTNGPILFLEVDGKQPGDAIHLKGPASLKVKARVQSPVPFTSLELIVNGQVVTKVPPAGDGVSAELNHTLSIDRSSWVAARVWGDGHRLVVNDPRVFAHTSPVYCYIDKQPIAFPEDARVVVAWIDRLIQDVVASPRFATEEKRNEVVALFRKGQRYYQEIAERGPR